MSSLQLNGLLAMGPEPMKGFASISYMDCGFPYLISPTSYVEKGRRVPEQPKDAERPLSLSCPQICRVQNLCAQLIIICTGIALLDSLGAGGREGE